MMKTYFSILFLLSLFCTNAQEITDKESFKKCRKEFSKKMCLSDEDRDGILFYLDQCPKEAGFEENNGCPWTDIDGDGVIDKYDACSKVAGPPENNGCPWPDTDGDGILDKDDACPTVAGYPPNGCSGRNGRSCPESYEQSKQKYFLQKLQIDNTDFLKLFPALFNNEDFKVNYFQGSKNILLYLKAVEDGPECGNDAYYDCPRYEKNITEDIFIKFWSKSNYEIFQKLSLDKNIIPYSNQDNWYQLCESDDENYNYLLSNSIKTIFKGIFIDNDNKKYDFSYTSNHKPTKKLILSQPKDNITKADVLHLVLRVLPIEYKNLQGAYIIDIGMNDGNSLLKKQLVYQYESDRWKFIEEFKIQFKN